MSVLARVHRFIPRLSLSRSIPFPLYHNPYRAMSLQAAIQKLNSPVKELVVAVTENGAKLAGETEKDQKEVVEWVTKTVEDEVAAGANIQILNQELLPKTYIVSNYLTAADVALYGALHPYFSKAQPTQYYSHPALTRYFDHIQSSPLVRPSADSLTSTPFTPVSFDIENAPKTERKVEPPKKKEKKPATGTAPAVSRDAGKSPAPEKAAPKETPDGAAVASGDKAPKKEKKEKKEKPEGEAKQKKQAADDGGEPVPSMIDLRVGRIVDVKKHPDADSLYVEQIDIGEETGPRTVVSGLVKYVPIEQMQNKLLIAVCNLKPASMRGVKSFAMVLCATAKEGKDGGVELIDPPAGAKPGDRVYFEGEEYENATALAQLNPKKKIFETIQPGFITLDTKEAAWINPVTKSVHKIRTKDGVCTAPNFVGASLS